MMKTKITARASATVANLICGFDTLALAIDGLYDEVSLIPNTSGHWHISEIINGANLPIDVHLNVCTASMEWMRQELNTGAGYDVSIHKGYQTGSGLGSSAASAVAALWAYNAILDYPLTRAELIPFAMKSEALVSGQPIADNVAAAALGGLVLIRSADAQDFISLPIPNLFVGCLLPDIQIITKQAREILPSQISLVNAVRQSADIAGFIHALHTKDWALLRRSLHNDLIEPYRGPHIPHYFQLKELALSLGALCFGIAGSGPAVFFISQEKTEALKIAQSLSTEWAKVGRSCIQNISKINSMGATIVKLE